MAAWQDALRSRAKGQLDFLSWSLILDWLVVAAVAVGSQQFAAHEPFERDVVHYLGQRDLSWALVEPEQVPQAMLDLITWHAPAAFLAALGAARLSLHEIHHGLLTLAASRALMRFIVELLKNAVGRLRPDFFARCRFSLLEQVCTGAEAVAMVILALVLAGKLRAFAWRGRAGRGGSSFAALTISLSPIPVALWVAVTRLEDNRHHPTDVLTGLAIGTIIALVVYPVYWPSPFASSNLRTMSAPRLPSRTPLFVDDDDEGEIALPAHSGDERHA